MVYSFLMLAAPLAVLGVPGSFGRYAEHYRQRGHLRTFLHRAAVWTAVCTLAARRADRGVRARVVAADLRRPRLRRPDPRHRPLPRHRSSCTTRSPRCSTALRLYRIVSAMNFAQSMLFAGISLGLMWRRAEHDQHRLGYAVACLVASVGAFIWAWPALSHLEPARGPAGARRVLGQAAAVRVLRVGHATC